MLKKDLEELLDREEILWKQRAKTQWLAEGDRNTSFFHAQAQKRQNQNHIEGLRDGNGDLQTELGPMGTIAVNYFEDIFRSRRPTDEEIDAVVGTMRSKVDHDINRDLSRQFTPLEVKNSLF